MAAHPYHDVAITGIFNTEQARVLEGEDSMSIAFKGGLGALADAGLGIRDVDGVVGQFANDFVYQARLSPAWVVSSWSGIPAILQAATAIADAACSTAGTPCHDEEIQTGDSRAW